MPQKHFLRRPLRFFRAPVYLENDVSVVHRVFRFSVPLLVDSSGRGGLTSAELRKNLSRLHQKAPSRELIRVAAFVFYAQLTN